MPTPLSEWLHVVGCFCVFTTKEALVSPHSPSGNYVYGCHVNTVYRSPFESSPPTSMDSPLLVSVSFEPIMLVFCNPVFIIPIVLASPLEQFFAVFRGALIPVLFEFRGMSLVPESAQLVAPTRMLLIPLATYSSIFLWVGEAEFLLGNVAASHTAVSRPVFVALVFDEFVERFGFATDFAFLHVSISIDSQLEKRADSENTIVQVYIPSPHIIYQKIILVSSPNICYKGQQTLGVGEHHSWRSFRSRPYTF